METLRPYRRHGIVRGMSTDDKQARIVAARLKLRERFLRRIEATPSLADDEPLGSGAINRHGMPKLPPEQHKTTKWPVLDLGVRPDVDKENWRLLVDGACDCPIELDYRSLLALEQVEDVSDFHCVTKWSRFDVPWVGIRFSELASLVSPTDDARFAMCYGYDGYTTNLPLEEALKPDVLLVYKADGQPLTAEHGGPVRMITPQLYAWKGAKWMKRIEFMREDRLGFWEQRGYSNTAHPWRNDRYA